MGTVCSSDWLDFIVMLGRKWGIMIMMRDESEDVGRDLIIIKRFWSRVGKFENCFEGSGEP